MLRIVSRMVGFCAAFGAILFGLCPGSRAADGPATVRQIKVLPDKAPDCSSLKSIAETGRPAPKFRLMYWLFDHMEFVLPARTRSELWPLERP